MRGIAETYLGDDSGDIARMFALAWLAAGDAFITTWNAKMYYDLWRPITAIQEGDFDGNPETDGDPNWQPFINTPSYPEYSSGANGLTGAMTYMLRRFFGTDEVTFDVASTILLADPKSRTYHRFSDMAQDVVDVRIYQGIHFRFGDEAGRKVSAGRLPSGSTRARSGRFMMMARTRISRRVLVAAIDKCCPKR